MPLIRNKNAAHVTHQAVALELENVRSQAESLLESSRAEAESIIAEARALAGAEAARIREEAREEGYRTGLADGLAEGRETGREAAVAEAMEPYQAVFSKLAPAWLEQFEQFGQERERLFEEARRDLVGFALELAESIVRRTIECDPEVCVGQLEEAVRLLGRPTRMEVRIHPEDREVIERALPGLLAGFASTPDLELTEQASVGRGGCVVTTPEGAVDSGIDVQLERVMQALLPGAGP